MTAADPRRLLLTTLFVIGVSYAMPASEPPAAAAGPPAADPPPATGSNSELVSYLPFYGGAAGQFLAVTRDPHGAVLEQRIVPADAVPADVDPLERAVRALHALAARALEGRGRAERATRLRALAAASADLLRLLRRADPDAGRYSEDDVGEEGDDGSAVEVDADGGVPYPPGTGGATLVADARPVGLAVVATSGVAASKPVATALAASGVALARPVATAVAGLDPALLGINLNLGQHRHRPADPLRTVS